MGRKPIMQFKLVRIAAGVYAKRYKAEREDLEWFETHGEAADEAFRRNRELDECGVKPGFDTVIYVSERIPLREKVEYYEQEKRRRGTHR